MFAAQKKFFYCFVFASLSFYYDYVMIMTK